MKLADVVEELAGTLAAQGACSRRLSAKEVGGWLEAKVARAAGELEW